MTNFVKQMNPINKKAPCESREPFKVTVSITLSKDITVNLPNPGHFDNGNWISDRKEIMLEDVRTQIYLPDELLALISKYCNGHLKQDASGWNVDELEVIED